MEYLESVRQIEQQILSRFAKKSTESAGRKIPLTDDPKRTEFERDVHRIQHSWPFRRLRNKAQVFYAPKNDHLCTRIEHALHVASISKTICRHLALNCDLAEAIALAHDLGHPPFGHIGEEIIKRLHKSNHLPVFKHEAQSLRVIDRFKNNGNTLDLTFEVRDGVVCHCGEKFIQKLRPNRRKDITLVEPSAARRQNPATLEACVVRVADVISYIGRDYEDAIQVGIIPSSKLPPHIRNVLGSTNREIIHIIIGDILNSSKEIDAIVLSDPIYNATCALKNFNTRYIYKSPMITSQIRRIEQMLWDIFYFFLEVSEETNRGTKRKRKYRSEAVDVFYEFLEEMEYTPTESDAQIVSDFLAGMTDTYATRVYQELFLVSPPA
ncbi:MAG: HD domain-containing protein [Deltaproteobacteria bacterium]|nr:HD domain-containing protein [Deltaproteobacteria bacterium]